MHLSAREVFQLSYRCCYAEGFPDGSSRAIANAIRWTELARGTGLTTLHGLLEELPDLERSRVGLRDRSPCFAALDGDGQPGLVAVNPALDLACSMADRHGMGVVHTPVPRDDPTLSTLGYAAYRAGERGRASVVLYTDGAGQSAGIVGTPDQPCPQVAEMALDAPPASYGGIERVVEAGLHRQRDNPLFQAFFSESVADQHTTANKRLLHRLLRGAVDPARAGDAGPGFVTICIDPTHPQYTSGVQHLLAEFVEERAAEFTTVYRPDKFAERATAQLCEGVDVDGEVWEDIFEVSSGILAPPFEGSHQGAGFDINE